MKEEKIKVTDGKTTVETTKEEYNDVLHGKEPVIKQTEKLVKEADGTFTLNIQDYGGVKDQTLTQHFTKEKLKEQYTMLKGMNRSNVDEITQIKKSNKEYTLEEREELDKFMELNQKASSYQKWIQADARKDQLLAQQEGIRTGLKQIESVIPELKR